MNQLKLEILNGFHGGLDSHGFAKNDADDIYEFALKQGITDGDQARKEFCAYLQRACGLNLNCPHS